MARRKLNPFTADEAGDAFVPTVKTIKGANIPSAEDVEKSSKKEKQQIAKPAPVASSVEQTGANNKSASEAKEKPVPAKNSAPPKAVAQSVSQTPKQEQAKPMKSKLASDNLPAEAEQPVTGKKKEGPRDQIIEMVGFQLGDSEFGIDIKQVQDINRMIDITTVPKAPHFVRGVMNLRGKVIPVLSMRSRFGLEDQENSKSSRIIVVEVKGTTIGFIVDAVSEVLRVSSKTIENTTDLVNWIDAEYIKGVAKYHGRLLVLIDLEKVIFAKGMSL